MTKFEHWQDPGKDITHGWVTAEDIPTRDRRTVVILRAPILTKIVIDMAGAAKLHKWLGDLIEAQSAAAVGQEKSNGNQ